MSVFKHKFVVLFNIFTGVVFAGLLLFYWCDKGLWLDGGRTLISGYSVYWSVAQLASQHHFSWAYQEQYFEHYVKFFFPGIVGNFGWYYAPVAGLFLIPFAGLPYNLGFLIFMLLGALLLNKALTLEFKLPQSSYLLFGFSGFWLNWFAGQNGFYTLSLALFFLYLLNKKTILAGFLMGFLIVKIHLMILFIVALVAGKHFKGLVGLLISIISMYLLTSFVFGHHIWNSWVNNMQQATHMLLIDGFNLSKMPTFFSFLRLHGLDTHYALTIQGIISVVLISWVGWVWFHQSNDNLKKITLFASMVLISPYYYYSDLIWFLPIMFYSRELYLEGVLALYKYKLLMIIIWACPIVYFIGMLTKVDLSWIVLLASVLVLCFTYKTKRPENH